MNRDGVFTRKVIVECLSVSIGLPIDEIARRSGYTRRCVTYVLNELRAAGRAYIAEWKVVQIDEERWTRPVPLFVRGKGVDAIKPRALSVTERRIRHEEREARRQEMNAFNIVVKNDA